MVSALRAVCVTVALAGSPAAAQSTAITETAASFTFSMNGTQMTIGRSGLSCPGSCIQPMYVANGVATLGELEVIEFLQSSVGGGRGLVIDVRMPHEFVSGALPGAVNVPVATFGPDNPYRNDLLSALGVINVGAAPQFQNAYSLLIYAGGADDFGASDAIKALLASGYPPEKIKYYRGGASSWGALGLSLAVAQ